MQDITNAMTAIDMTWFCLVLVGVAMDIVTGYAQAMANRELMSSKMRDGFYHKLGIMLSLVAAAMVDIASSRISIGFDAPVFEGFCGYILVMEITSICENLAKINPELAARRSSRRSLLQRSRKPKAKMKE